jgi:putative transposase
LAKRFWEHCVRDEEDFRRCVDYVYYNPVKHGYVDSLADGAFSSFSRDVAKGIYEDGWGGDIPPRRIKGLNWE